ncbi:MAG TPA: DUF4115 domain-containing protein [bacterium]|nr:DUF4115 domain-containing protein [bacterium]
MAEIGDTLRQAREAQHISIKGAARRLKIREKYLQALEDEDFAVLPQGAYILGFLRNYAMLLGVNYRELRDAYRMTHQSEPLPAEITPDKRKNKSVGFVLTPARVIGILIVIVSGLLLWYLYTQYQELTRPPVLAVYSPQGGEVYTSRTIKIAGQTDPNARLTINGEEVYLSSNGYFEREFVALKNGPENLEFVTENKISKQKTSLNRTFTIALPSSEVITLNEQGEVVEDDPAAGTETEGLALKIRVDAQVWMSVSVDEGKAQEFLLEEGQEKTFRAAETIYIHCGKAYATYISVNGGEETVLGDTSIVKKTYQASDY